MEKTDTCTLYVSGMHCGACEVLLNKKITKLDGVKDVKASLSDSKVEITYQKGRAPKIDYLNKNFADLGYSFSNQPIGQAKFGQLQISHLSSSMQHPKITYKSYHKVIAVHHPF